MKLNLKKIELPNDCSPYHLSSISLSISGLPHFCCTEILTNCAPKLSVLLLLTLSTSEDLPFFFSLLNYSSTMLVTLCSSFPVVSFEK